MKKILDKSYFQRTNRGQNGESGRSLVEMLGTIAIITVITIGSIAAGGVGMTTWRTSELRDDLDVIMQTIVDLYSWDRDGFPVTANIEKFFCKEGGFHRCECKDETCDTYDLLSPWGTDVFIDSSGGSHLEITVHGVPAMACRQLEGSEGIYWTTNTPCPQRGLIDMTFTLKENF